MIIRFTHAQIEPIAARLKRMGEIHRPSEITPERWSKIVNGKSCRLEFRELQAISSTLGWDEIFGSVRAHSKKRRQRAKAAA